MAWRHVRCHEVGSALRLCCELQQVVGGYNFMRPSSVLTTFLDGRHKYIRLSLPPVA